MKKIIVITAFRRPNSLKNLLSSLRSNNLNGWSILIQLEPSSETSKCVSLCQTILKGQDFKVHVNKTVEGIRNNTFNVTQAAFSQGADLILYLEEDLIVSPDALDMCNWYYDNHSDDILCLNLLARSTGSSACLSSLDYPKELIKTKSFNSLGVALTKRQWMNFFKDSWLLKPENHLTYGGQKTDGWDFSIYAFLLSHPTLHVLQPLLARVNHVGGKGTYCTDEYQEKSFSYVQISQGSKEQYCITQLNNLKGAEKAFFILMDEMNSCIHTLSNVEEKRKDNLNNSFFDRLAKKAKERTSVIKSLENNQLIILSAKEKWFYKFLKYLLSCLPSKIRMN